MRRVDSTPGGLLALCIYVLLILVVLYAIVRIAESI